MKRIASSLLLVLFLLCGCSGRSDPAQIAATTLPVYEFTSHICQGTGLHVTLLVSEPVSCLHDYSLSVDQVRAAEGADLVVISGAGLEEFMDEILSNKPTLDSSAGITLLECGSQHSHDHHHHHEADAHIWLSPANAMAMARNICDGLTAQYPEHAEVFSQNLDALLAELSALEAYGQEQLKDLSTRNLITFHDGFGYFAESFGLTILEAVEEESGSEASAQELKHLITLVRQHQLPAIFTEVNGSASAADTIARETGVQLYALDMAMSGSYFDAMYHNIDTIKEALG